MIFSVSNNGIEWSFDFGPASVSLIVKNLFQDMAISSQDFPLAAWSLLLSERQDFWNIHLLRVPITPNQEGTMELKDEVLSSVGEEGMDTRVFQVSVLDDVEFYW